MQVGSNMRIVPTHLVPSNLIGVLRVFSLMARPSCFHNNECIASPAHRIHGFRVCGMQSTFTWIPIRQRSMIYARIYDMVM